MVRLAMAWVIQRQGIDGVLIGARNTGHIVNAIESVDAPLPPELLAEMDSWI